MLHDVEPRGGFFAECPYQAPPVDCAVTDVRPTVLVEPFPVPGDVLDVHGHDALAVTVDPSEQIGAADRMWSCGSEPSASGLNSKS